MTAIADFFARLNGGADGAPLAVEPPPPATIPLAPSAQRPTPGASETAAVQPHPDPEARARYERLEELDKRLKNCELSWIPLGETLREIRDDRLYLVRFDSFEEYVRERLEKSRSQAYALIEAAAVARDVRRARHRLSFRAAVQLGKLPTDDRLPCLQQILAGAGTLRPSADYVRDAVAAWLAKTGSREAAQPRKKKRGKGAPIRWRSQSGVVLTVTASRGETDLRALLREWLADLESPAAIAAGNPKSKI